MRQQLKNLPLSPVTTKAQELQEWPGRIFFLLLTANESETDSQQASPVTEESPYIGSRDFHLQLAR